MKNRLPLYGFLVAVGLMCGCAGMPGESLVQEVAPEWSPALPVDVFYENTDTLGERAIGVLVRFRNDFSCDRLDVVLETLTPDSLVWRDTVSVSFGGGGVETASLTYTDVKTPYRSRSRFGRPGTYRFRFTPANPGSCTEGVIGVGVEITTN